MVGFYYLNDEQSRRIDVMLDWYERVGKHLEPPSHPYPYPRDPIPMEMAKPAASSVTLKGGAKTTDCSSGITLNPIRVITLTTKLCTGSSGPAGCTGSTNLPFPSTCCGQEAFWRDTGTEFQAYPLFHAPAIGSSEPVAVFRHRQSGRRLYIPNPFGNWRQVELKSPLSSTYHWAQCYLRSKSTNSTDGSLWTDTSWSFWAIDD